MTGIYIVERETESETVRSVVIASSADAAVESIGEKLADVDARHAAGIAIRVGRIGSYEPGIEGARMTSRAVIVTGVAP
jgi:hypothetical protein